MWSTTNTLTSTFLGSSLQPSCDRTASLKLGPDTPSSPAIALSSTQYSRRSRVPSRPVASTTGALTGKPEPLRDLRHRYSVVAHDVTRPIS